MDRKRTVLGIVSVILCLIVGCSSNDIEKNVSEESSMKEELDKEALNMTDEYVSEIQTPQFKSDYQDFNEEDLIAIAEEAKENGLTEDEIVQFAEDVGCEPDILMQYINEIGGATTASSVDDKEASESLDESQQMQVCSLNEMLSASKNTQDTIFALKKGDSYYPLIGKPNLVRVNGLIVRDANEPDKLLFKYGEGDSIVAFSSNSLISVFQELLITDDTENYCLPFCFWENADETISGDIYWVDDVIINSYVSGNKLMSSFEEYEGTRVYEDTSDKTASITFNFILEGNKDEVLELGGYNGTVFETVQYKCNARYYTTSFPIIDGEEVVTLGSDNYINTKEGYAIVTNAETNRLEKGLYLIENVMIEVLD